MYKRALKGITCWHNVTPELFKEEIFPLHQPAILKGLVNDWPAVKQAKHSVEGLYQYFSDLYIGGDTVQFNCLGMSSNNPKTHTGQAQD